MQLIEQIKQYSSVSIVGMAKNTGKTTCLNYVLGKLAAQNYRHAVTSIGVDGEERDVLYDTLKPRITIYNKNMFATSEKHFNETSINATILSVGSAQTALGKLIIAEANSTGQVILSGPSDATSIADFIFYCKKQKVPLILIDGALSRMSLASPAITDALVLCTGAACSNNLEKLIKKVKYQCELIQLPQVIDSSAWFSFSLEKYGVWGLQAEQETPCLLAESLFTNEINVKQMLRKYRTIYIAGALTDNFLKEVIEDSNVKGFEIVVNDFSHIFALNSTFYKFIRRSGMINVLKQANLIALCSNPTSPEGYNFAPKVLQNALAEALNLPVYDILAS